MTSSAPPNVAAQVWLADNSAAGREHTRGLLSRVGHHVETFADAAGLLERLARQAAEPPDLLLLDWLMPGVSGVEVCRFVRERFSPTELPILVLTASTDEGDLEEALGAGANDYIVKPARLVELRARVQSLLQASQVAQRLRVQERERERALAEAEAARMRLTTILSTLEEGVVLQDAQGVLHYCNAAAERLLGLSAEQLARGTSADPCWGAVREDGSPVPGEEHPPIRALRTGHAVTGDILGVRQADGRRAWLSVNAQPLFERDGKTPSGVVSSFFDVTALRAAAVERERLLGEVEAARVRLASLFENAPAIICTFRGAELVYELSNPLHQRLVGVDRSLVGRPVREAVPEAVDQGVVALLERVYRAGEPYLDRELSLRLDRQGDGTLVEAFVDVVYQPARDAAGHVVGVDVFGFDVTRQVLVRHEVEALAARLRQSEERLRRVVEASGTGTWEVDVAAGLVSADARHLRLMGLLPGDTQALDTHFGAVHAEDRARLEGAVSAVLAGEGGGRFHADFRTVGSGVTPERWLEVRGQADFDSQGKPLRLIGTSVDITASKVAEEALRLREAEFRTLAEASPDSIFTTTPEGVLTYVSPSLLRHTGLTLEDLAGTGYRDVIHPDHRGPSMEAFARALHTGEPYTYEHPVRGADGGYRWHLVRALPVRDTEGRVVKWVGTSVDVHVLRQAQAEMEQRADFEQQLIGIVSHDLRNPIAAITMSAATLLRRPDFEERQRRALMRILTSAERAHRMIRDLLDFTQARLGGGLPVVPTPGDVHATVRQVVEEVEETHSGRDIQFEQSGSGQGLWDADRLAQAVGNLLSNALHYSPPGTPVRVASRGEEGAVVLTVHNEGTPIPPEVLPRLFQPMQRGAQGPTHGRSVGLGLYIVDQVVRAHGGTIEVASTVETATTFTVRLPRRAARGT